MFTKRNTPTQDPYNRAGQSRDRTSPIMVEIRDL
ncbi:unnamed protein product, partial [marine sediment metagenome]